MVEIRSLDAAEARAHAGSLGAVLVDCVEGGASVGFVDRFGLFEAEKFYLSAAEGVGRGERVLLAAFLESDLVGTVQVVFAGQPNQPHRAEVAKLLVARRARGRRIARRLMAAAEEAARAAGRPLLVLDTATGEAAEALYAKLGWNRVGVIPRYALYPDGRWCDTTVFWKWVG